MSWVCAPSIGVEKRFSMIPLRLQLASTRPRMIRYLVLDEMLMQAAGVVVRLSWSMTFWPGAAVNRVYFAGSAAIGTRMVCVMPSGSSVEVGAATFEGKIAMIFLPGVSVFT